MGISLVIFILACCGATQILQYAKILDNLRPTKGFFGEMLKCSMCTGFHVGWIFAILFQISGILFLEDAIINAIIMGFVSSFVSYFADKTIGDDGINIFFPKKQNFKDYEHDKWI